MKVLHILNELKPSGGETMLKSAAPQWCSVDEHVILSTGDRVGSYSTVLHQSGYEILHLPFRKSLSFFKGFAALLKAGSYDIVHIHTERAAPLYALVARFSAPGKPVIFRTVHHFFRFDGVLRIRKMLERHMMKYLLGVKFLSNSPSGVRNEKRRYGMTNAYAPNWYDSGLFSPPNEEDVRKARSSLGWPDDLTVFVSLGGNWPYKNYDRVVKALAEIPAHHKLHYVQIGVQGDGSPLETLANELGVTERLHCAGIVKDVLPLLWAADAYLMPSTEEGFGIAAVEAMAVGLPAILGEVEALTDFRETVEGLRFVRPEAIPIAEAMVEFIKLGRTKLRERGLAHSLDVREHYGLEVGPVAYLKAWNSTS